MRPASNTLIVILGIVSLIALVVFLKLHIRWSAIHSLGRLCQTRLAANHALRRRLQPESRPHREESETQRHGGLTRSNDRKKCSPSLVRRGTWILALIAAGALPTVGQQPD